MGQAGQFADHLPPGNLNLSPSEPTASFPDGNQAKQLAPNCTIAIHIKIEETSTVNPNPRFPQPMKPALQLLLAAIVITTTIPKQGSATEQAAATGAVSTYVEDPDLLPAPRLIEIPDTPWRIQLQFTEPESVRKAIADGHVAGRAYGQSSIRLTQEGRQIVYRQEDHRDDLNPVVMEAPEDLEAFAGRQHLSAILHRDTNVVELTGRTTDAEPATEIRFYRVDPPNQARLLLKFGQIRIPGAPGLAYDWGWLDARHYIAEGGVRLSIEEELERRKRLGILLDEGISTDATPYKERYLFLYDALEDVQYLHQIKDPLLINTGHWEHLTTDGWHRTSIALDPPEKGQWARAYLRLFRIDLDPDSEAEQPGPPDAPEVD